MLSTRMLRDPNFDFSAEGQGVSERGQENEEEEKKSYSVETDSDGDESVGSRGSDASNLTVEFLSFKHSGWSYKNYLDTLERLERAPKQMRELQARYREERHNLAGSFDVILAGARERRQYYASLAPMSKEKLDEQEVHRLSRDGIRRRYELEQKSRSHDKTRDKYMKWLLGGLTQARRDMENRRELRNSMLPSAPSEAKTVEIGAEFATIEWQPPKKSAGDVRRYEISGLDVTAAKRVGYSGAAVDEARQIQILLEQAAVNANLEGDEQEGEGSDVEEVKGLNEEEIAELKAKKHASNIENRPIAWRRFADLEREFNRTTQVFTLNDLEPNRRYLLRVRAQNCAGWGPWSEPTMQPIELFVDEQFAGREKRKRNQLSVLDDSRDPMEMAWLEHLFEEISSMMERNRTGMTELFKQFDKRGTGLIDKRDIHDTLNETYGLALDEDKLTLLLGEFDRDGNDSVDYEEFINTIEDYRFRSHMKTKDGASVTMTAALGALQGNRSNMNRDMNLDAEGFPISDSMLQRRRAAKDAEELDAADDIEDHDFIMGGAYSTDSFDSDELRHDLSGFDPSDDVVVDETALLEQLNRFQRKNGESKEKDGVGGGGADTLVRRFEHFGHPKKSRRRIRKRAEQKEQKKSGSGYDADTGDVDEYEDAVEHGDDELLKHALKMDKDNEDNFDEYKDKFGHLLAAPHDPLQDMSRSEIVVRLPDFGDASLNREQIPFKLKRDDLGRLVVTASQDEILQAGVTPGYYLTRIGERHHIWPPARRRIGRWFAVQRLLKDGPRPLKLVFEKSYPAKTIKAHFGLKDEDMGMALEQHPESRVIYVGSIDDFTGCPAKIQGLQENDIITCMEGVEQQELIKVGLKSSRMRRILEKRPLLIEVQRGPPVHMSLLPPRSRLDPLMEAKLARKAEKVAALREKKLDRQHGGGHHRNSLAALDNSLFVSGGEESGDTSNYRSSLMRAMSFKHSGVGSQFSHLSHRSGGRTESADSVGGRGSLLRSISFKHGGAGSTGSVGSTGTAGKKSSSVFASLRRQASFMSSGRQSPGSPVLNGDESRKRPSLGSRQGTLNQSLVSMNSFDGNELPGMVYLTLTTSAKSLNIAVTDSTGGVKIAEVESKGVGEKIGLVKGDLLVGIGDRRYGLLKRVPRAHFNSVFNRAQRPVQVTVARDKRIANKIRIASLKKARSKGAEIKSIHVTLNKKEMPGSSGKQNKLLALTGGAELERNEDGKGFTVKSIAPGSLPGPRNQLVTACAAAGVRAGDSLKAVNQVPLLENPSFSKRTKDRSEAWVIMVPSFLRVLSTTPHPLVLTFERVVETRVSESYDGDRGDGLLPPTSSKNKTKKNVLLAEDAQRALGGKEQVQVLFSEVVKSWASLGIDLKADKGHVAVKAVAPSKAGSRLGICAKDKIVGIGHGPSLGVLEGRRRGSFTVSRMDAIQWLRAGQLGVKQLKNLITHGERPVLLIVEREAAAAMPSPKVGGPSATSALFRPVGFRSGNEEGEDEELHLEQAETMGDSESLDIGDQCEWKGEDEDVPRGTVGTVVAVHDDGDVEVAFPTVDPAPGDAPFATFTFARNRLRKYASAEEVAAEKADEHMHRPRLQRHASAVHQATYGSVKPTVDGGSPSTILKNALQLHNRGARGTMSVDRPIADAGDAGPPLPVSQQTAPPRSTPSNRSFTSSVLVLLDLVSPETLEDSTDFQDILEDVTSECRDFGEVIEVFIPRGSEGDESGLGKIYVEFESEVDAAKAADGIAGRDFDGRTIKVAFLDENAFDEGRLDDHSQPWDGSVPKVRSTQPTRPRPGGGLAQLRDKDSEHITDVGDDGTGLAL